LHQATAAAATVQVKVETETPDSNRKLDRRARGPHAQGSSVRQSGQAESQDQRPLCREDWWSRGSSMRGTTARGSCQALAAASRKTFQRHGFCHALPTAFPRCQWQVKRRHVPATTPCSPVIENAGQSDPAPDPHSASPRANTAAPQHGDQYRQDKKCPKQRHQQPAPEQSGACAKARGRQDCQHGDSRAESTACSTVTWIAANRRPSPLCRNSAAKSAPPQQRISAATRMAALCLVFRAYCDSAEKPFANGSSRRAGKRHRSDQQRPCPVRSLVQKPSGSPPLGRNGG